MPVVTGQERKTVTVLFCDLVGYTQLAEELDPEDVASLLGPYHERVRRELERFGGTVEKFIGDAVMALFGAPVAHEDDPERAVRAGFEIREFAMEAGIELRIGIATGPALVSLGARPEHGEAMATGDVVNTAARVQAAAPVNGVLVTEMTHEATRDAIEYEEVSSVEAKGKAKPIPVWRALRARSRIALDRPHATPLVGRARELDLLTDALARARAEHQPQLVTLVGVPGIGKSRLVYELSQAADRDPELISWRQGRCLPYGDGVTFWALAEIIKTHLGILDTDTAEQAERKLFRAAPEEWIRTQLRPLVGLGVDGAGEGDRREEAFVAWRRFLEGIAAERPLVLVFEDLHWADESLLDFVDHVVEWASGVDLLVVGTARPELLEAHPSWGGGKTNALTLSISPLSDEETSRLVGGLIQRAVMPAETQEALLARAGGNPLYAEQYARLLEERLAEDLPLPETVQAIIAARLDALDPGQKALLQDAAVLGKTFWLSAVASISEIEGKDAEAILHRLERRGFVRRERESSIEGDTEYAFLHVLMRDVAYGQIPRPARVERHRRAAEWIEGLGRSEDQAELLAHHRGEALDLARAARLDTSALEEPARLALRDAGDRALSLSAYSAALTFYERALDAWPEDDAERPRLAFNHAKAYFHAVDESRVDLIEEARDALLAAGDRETAAEAGIFLALAERMAGRPGDAVELARAAANLLEEAPPSAAKAFVLRNLAAMLVYVSGRIEEGAEVALASVAMADELGLVELRAGGLVVSGYARVVNDDFAGIENMEEALHVMLVHGSPYELARVYNNLTLAYFLAGRVEQAHELLPAYFELNERYGFPSRVPWNVAAIIAWELGDWDEAERRFDDMGLDAPTGDNSYLLCVRARMRLARDDVAGAVRDCAKALALPADQWEGAGGDYAEGLCVAATVALADGRETDARALTDQIFASGWAPRNDQFHATTELALLLARLGRPAGVIAEAAEALPRAPWLQVAAAVVRGDLQGAADRLAALKDHAVEADVRLRAAEYLVAEGRRAEANAQLKKAVTFYRSVGATRYIRQCEALLEEADVAVRR